MSKIGLRRQPIVIELRQQIVSNLHLVFSPTTQNTIVVAINWLLLSFDNGIGPGVTIVSRRRRKK
ncbi:hypothetical protein TorRG33x02_323540 [Trema orientale]|uniref:Uncharacterized protein n=1 Tax=Trema orientale TaxID=63057 RepID=A0A2P5BEZ8_TREOI|nr:hypothetical protein TorRG33x02_323540 [Trema orientale]